MNHPWDGIVPLEDQRAYQAAGFGQSAVLGQRPALLIIDVQFRTIGTRPQPYDEAVKEYATSCGEVGWRSLERIAGVLDLFRTKKWPVIYPYVAPKRPNDAGRLSEKIPSIMGVDERGYEFPEAIKPAEGDILVAKRHPSAFFGTPLASYLINLGVDTLVVTGCSTSGCVRSTVIDAFSYNYRVLVPDDAVFDRSHVSHAVNLFDMNAKYANVISSEMTKRILAAVEQGAVS